MNKKKSMADLGRLKPQEFAEAAKVPLTVILDNVRSGHNVGSVFRTADAFLVEHVVLCGITPQPPQKDILKTALGASQTVRWSYVEHTIAAVELLCETHEIWSVEQAEQTKEISEWEWSGKPVAIVLGNEVKGVDQAVVDASEGCIELTQYGTKHSLNISVCAGIVMHRLAGLMRTAGKQT